MSQNVYSFRFAHRNSYKRDTIAVLLSLLATIFAAFLFVEVLKFADLIPSGHVVDARLLHASVLENAAYTPPAVPDVHMDFHGNDSSYGFRGEQGIRLWEFSFSSPKEAKLQRLVFSLKDPDASDDIHRLQLSVDGKFVTEKPVFGGFAIFDGLNLHIQPDEELHLEITGDLSDDAHAGHRIQIGIADPENILIQSSFSKPYTVDMDFPSWGPAVSVIGSPL